MSPSLPPSPSIPERIAAELQVRPAQVEAAVKLLDEGSTVPFIARYRKEVTGLLDDIQLRALEERLRYLRELEAERGRILSSISEQGKLTPELEARIREADSKARLEDLYLPYRPKRRTKAQIAREAGLEPLLDLLIKDPRLVPEQQAQAFLNAELGFADTPAVLEGVSQILQERAAEDADLLAEVRETLRREGLIVSTVIHGKETEAATFRDWFAYRETFSTVPSHRALAVFRGQSQGLLDLCVKDKDFESGAERTRIDKRVSDRLGIHDRGRPADPFLLRAARDASRYKVLVRAELALMTELRKRAEEEAIRVFASNLRDLLLASPAGSRVVLGLDPGIRTGVKVALVDGTGRVLEVATIYPFQPRNDTAGSLRVLGQLVERHGVELIAIGNGTASRETDRLARELIGTLGGPKPSIVVVSEAGASVYSASELGSQELSQMDVSLRGAVSIARRLQDPLAELVKIDPRSIGVGQYQHDVNPGDLERSLDGVVEDCVNAVGVDLNTASVALLSRVAGLGPNVAKNIVAYRDEKGAFRKRNQILEVPRLGPKTFEQCAGFLRIRDGDDPLDASAVHPESYSVVERIAKKTGRTPRSLIGDSQLLRALRPQDYIDDRFGLPTVKDILAELEKPGRDPRPEFRTAKLRDDVTCIEDLQPGQWLEGTVTNVAAFGAFVDIGVHQDGLVHVSALANRFVKDPREVVKTGDVVKVRVMEVDRERKRIALSMRNDEEVRPARSNEPRREPDRPRPQRPASPEPQRRQEQGLGSFADLLRKAGVKR